MTMPPVESRGNPAPTPAPTPLSSLSPQDARDRRGFGRDVFRLMLPITLQSLISAGVNTADVLMLSRAGQEALSAVSLAGQVSFFLSLFYFGLAAGAGILTAQYWSRKDVRVVEMLLSLAAFASCVISAVFFALTLACPRALMRVFTPDAALISLGADYLRAVGASYLFMAFSQMALSVYKGMGRVKACAVVSGACLLVNIALNAVSIFVLFPGRPREAILGVAAATVVSRAAELALCWGYGRRNTALRARSPFRAAAWLRRDLWRCTLPVLGNYFVWGGAMTAIPALLGHIGADVVAANSVSSSVRNLAIVACTGAASGGSILIGQYLGAGRLELARYCGDKLARWSLLIGAAAGVLVLLARPACVALAALSPQAESYLSAMLIICAVGCVGKSYNSTVVAGIFCAGGDTRYGLVLDAIAMWGVVLPVAALGAFVWHWQPLVVCVVLGLDEFVKLPFVVARYRKYRWLVRLTRDASLSSPDHHQGGEIHDNP